MTQAERIQKRTSVVLSGGDQGAAGVQTPLNTKCRQRAQHIAVWRDNRDFREHIGVWRENRDFRQHAFRPHEGPKATIRANRESEPEAPDTRVIINMSKY